jgi:putative (di)nucleoside polyphosphate hydrolase
VHRWFLFDALAADVAPTPDGSEFVAWRWVEPAWLIENVAEMRRPAYQRVLGTL